MDEVYWGPGAPSAADRPRRVPGRFTRWWAELAERAATRRPGGLAINRPAAGLLGAGVVALLASQYYPWASIGLSGGEGSVQLALPASSTAASPVGIADVGTLALPYYLCWLAALALCAAGVAGGRPRPSRRLLGAAAGALAMVIVVVLPVMGKPSRLDAVTSLALRSVDLQITAHRQAGMYLALIAVVLCGLALVVVARGRPRPAAEPEPGVAAGATAWPDPGIAALPGFPAPNAFTTPPPAATDGDRQPDHSPYTRPADYRR